MCTKRCAGHNASDMQTTTHPVLAALAQARLRAAPMFARWCQLNAVSPCPASPASVARFVADCAPLGIERLWPAVQEISNMHLSIGLADPTLGGPAVTAISDLAGIEPPRSWPDDRKQRFRSLPYDLQIYVVSRRHSARKHCGAPRTRPPPSGRSWRHCSHCKP